jgi:solute carrier family 36 (proton-coupled amino acid transporter)
MAGSRHPRMPFVFSVYLEPKVTSTTDDIQSPHNTNCCCACGKIIVFAHLVFITPCQRVDTMTTEREDLLLHVDGELSDPTTSSSSQPFEMIKDLDDDHDHPSHHPNNVNNHHKISDWEAGISLAKAIMGAGSFALPWAFSKMGYVAGPIIMTLLLIMSVHSIQLLVQCCAILRRNQQQQQQQQQLHQLSSVNSTTTSIQSYVDVARSSFGATGARCAYVASMSASLGVCGSYLVFIAANLESLLLVSFHNDDPVATTSTTDSNKMISSQMTLIWIILPVVVSLSAVRDMKYFVMASFLGDVSVTLGMAVVMVYGTMKTNQSNTSWGNGCVAVGSLGDMALAFGSIGYLFLVHFLVIPIESSMERPQNFSQVAATTFSTCAMLSGLFGVFGYLMFGNETEQIVLLNVRQGSFFVTAVKVLLCIDLILTYPVVMRPSIFIVEESVDWWRQQRQHRNQKKSSLRYTHTPSMVDGKTHLLICSVLGIIAASASIFIPAFGLLSGLVGGVSQTFLAFVLPPLMWAKQQQQQSPLFASILRSLPLKERTLVLCGFVLIIWTLHSTWTEIREMR